MRRVEGKRMKAVRSARALLITKASGTVEAFRAYWISCPKGRTSFGLWSKRIITGRLESRIITGRSALLRGPDFSVEKGVDLAVWAVGFLDPIGPISHRLWTERKAR